MPLASGQRLTYFPALTGLRAIAAYMVFVYHYNPFHIARFPALHHFTDQLHTGVSLFFVLSGFLLFYRYGSGEKIDIRPYFQNRFAKIYPVFFLLTMAAWMNSDFERPLPFLFNITLLKGLFDDLKFAFIPQTWSLTTEEFFYLFLPLIVAVKPRYRYAVLLPGFILTGIVLVLIFRDNSFFGFFDSFKFMFTYTFFGRCTEFFAGVALAQYMSTRTITTSSWRFTAYGISAIMLVLVTMAAVSAGIGVDGNRLWVVAINNLLFPLAVVVLLYGLCKEQTFMSRILSTRIFQLLGKSSYVFYLNPLVLLPAAAWEFIDTIPYLTLVVFFLAIVVSILVYLFVEKPLHRLLSARS